MSVALFSALKNWGWTEVLCGSRPTQPLRLPAAQSPTMAETLHPAFSGVQQYTGREARRPAPQEAPPRRSPAPWARPFVLLPTSSRGPIPALCPAGPAPQIRPQAGLGPAPNRVPASQVRAALLPGPHPLRCGPATPPSQDPLLAPPSA